MPTDSLIPDTLPDVEGCLSAAFSMVYDDDNAPAAWPWFRAAVTLAPECGEGWAGLAEFAAAAGAVVTGYRRAVLCDAGQWRWRMAWGEALLANGDFAAAEPVFAAATAERPSAGEAWRGLSLALEGLGMGGVGADAARQWVALCPSDGEAACGLARLLLAGDDPHGAAEALGPFAAVGRGDDDPAILILMARAWLTLGETAKARGVLQRAAAVAPADEAVAVLLAEIDGAAGVGAPTQAYVRALFDRYAERFDRDLVEKLGYVAPSVLAAAVERVLAETNRADGDGLRVLDLGCGTGLSGEPFRRMAAVLHGVDLSPAMIAQAEKRKLYDGLAAESLQEALARQAAAWDLLVAADVLAYVGPLTAVFTLSAQALVPGGYLAFVVEAMTADELAVNTDAGLVLRESRRYAHDDSYLRHELASAGLEIVVLERAVLRRDRGQPIEGWCVVARR